MSLLSIAKKIKGNSCERLVKYTGQEYTISGANIGLGTFKIDIGSFQNKVKEINTIPPVMMALDNNQYLLCQQASQLDNNSQLKDVCLRIRLMHIMAFTQLQALLSIPPSEELGVQILEWTKQMGKLTTQSIDMLSQQPKVAYMEKTATKGGDRKTITDKAATIAKIYEEHNNKKTVAEIMKYQGIDESQMQEALKALKE